jgi:hypothetical protein
VLLSADCCRLLVLLLLVVVEVPSCCSCLLVLLLLCWLFLSCWETDLLSAGSLAPAGAACVGAWLLDAVAAFSRLWRAANWPLTGEAGHKALLTSLRHVTTTTHCVSNPSCMLLLC